MTPAEMYLSSGPYCTPFSVAPGLGAPPGPFPPPSMFVGAVGRGDELDFDAELDPLLLPEPEALLLPLAELLPDCCAEAEVRVKVKTAVVG